MAEYFLTQEGFNELEEKLNYLKSVRRTEVSQKISEARDLGDISENAEYDAAKDEQAFVEGEILEIETKLANAVIIDVTDTKAVTIGSKVTVEIASTKEKKVYTIVGTSETDPSAGRISNESPIGKSLIGKKAGSPVVVELPNRKTMQMKILSIKKG
ncbi:MAG: transcription elongation factor GreA [Clostridia bacterium]|nr:transcription elongation factor GreA [Clostridia bacterium]